MKSWLLDNFFNFNRYCMQFRILSIRPRKRLKFYKNTPGLLFKTLFMVCAILSAHELSSQTTITVNNYTSCPNQITTVTATWNNVGGATYTLFSPINGQPVGTQFLGSNTTFTISHPGPTPAANACFSYTLSGSGFNNSGPVASTVVFLLCIEIPAPLTLTNNGHYCPGQTATITAPGSIASNNFTSFVISGTNSFPPFNSPIMTFGPLGAQHTGTYTITAIGSCTAYGTTTIGVAPSTPLTVNGASNVCQCSVVGFTASLSTGTNFQWFGPLNQVICNTSSCTIACAQPTDAGVYTASADLPWGNGFCPRTATTQVSVVQTNPVSVTASPGNILCQGDKLSFSAIAGGEIGWTWSGPQSFVASISNPTINPVSAVHAGTYSVTALFSNNVITCTKSNTIGISVITVNQPVITMPASVCQNANVNLSASAPGALGYTWFGPSFNSSAQATVINNVQPSNSGLYYVTAKFGIGTTTCASSNSAQLNVVPVNSISIIPPAQVCQPNHGYLQCSAIGAISYTWQGPGSYVSPGPNATVYYPTPTVSGVYSVTASFGGGNITCYNSNTTQLTVNPILNFSLIPRQQVCYNTPVTVSGPSGASSYTWTSSNGFKAYTKDIKFDLIQPPSAGNYTLHVSLGPCVTSGSTIIEVLTPIQYTLLPKSRTLCKSDTTVFEVGATGGSQNYAFLWNPATFFTDPVGPKKYATPKSSLIYNIVAHDIACPHYTIGYSFSVTVNQPPKIDLKLNKTSGCAPLWLHLDTKGGADAAIVTYDFGGSKLIQNDNFDYALETPGTYSLTVYSTAKYTGCRGNYNFPSPLIVFPSPGADITWRPENPTTIDEVTFSSSVANDDEIIYSQWSFMGGRPSVIDTAVDFSVPGSDTSHATHPVRIYEKLGKYPVMFIVKNDKECTDTVAKFVPVIDDFRLFIPNTFTPNGDGINDVFNVKGIGIKTEGFSMEILDRWGAVIFSTKDINEGWNGEYSGNISTDDIFMYRIKAIGMSGEGKREFVGHVILIK